MSLQKSVTDPQGHTSNFWKIMFLKLDPVALICTFSVYCYKDSAAKVAGKAPCSEEPYSVSGATYTTWFDSTVLDVVSQNPQERAYEYLKTLASPVDFTTGTTDV